MPYKRRPRKARPAKKRRATKARKVARTTSVQRNFAVADTQVVRLRYGERIQINSGIATPGYYVFRANSLYDPNYTGTGHQPLGFDQWAAFYNHYLVLGSKIKVTFMPRGAGLTNVHICSITLRADSAQVVDTDTAIIENSKSKWGYAGGLYSKGGLTLRKGYSPATFFGKRILQQGDTTGALVSANPAEDVYFHINVASQDSTTDADTVDCVVQIDFIARLSERKQLSQS